MIWDNFFQFDEKNTIIVDDQDVNFYLNPKNGLKVTPYHRADHYFDTELLRVGKYLQYLARISTNFTEENLLHWNLYI